MDPALQNDGARCKRNGAIAKEADVIRELVTKSRTYRRFLQDKPVSKATLTDLIELARLIPSAGNRQPLKYILSNTREKNERVFPCLAWAAYLKGWGGPVEGERPAAYVIILGDSEISETVLWDHAIAAQTIALGAAEAGLGSCIIASIDRDRLKRELLITSQYQVLLVLALGYPGETVVLEEMKGGDCKYWRDEQSVHHVPKRSLAEIIIDLP
jgi:nitroreductase